MKIGYARVSTKEQNLDLQIDALQKAGCEKIFQEKASGKNTARPELDKMLEQLRKGDIVVIYKLDRLGRNLKHLVELAEFFDSKGISFISISENFDTTSSQGKLFFHFFASIAQFERDLIKERTMAGLESARKRGRIGGRPKGLSKKAERLAIIAESLYKENTLSVQEIADNLGIAKSTLYRYLRFRGVEIK